MIKLPDFFSETCRSGRVVVAIAGPPGAGKSTVSESWCEQLNQISPGCAAVVPMDGFHLPNAQLDKMGLRERKGSPDTFDAQGFVDLVQRIQATDESVWYPTFDRGLDASVQGGGVVPKGCQVVLVEGNYLLLERTPWNQVQYDYSVLLKPSLQTLQERLVQRWIDHGFSAQQSLEKAQHNDLPNAKTVLISSRPADLML